uniref:BUD13 homolog n=1 Tax=Chrysotila carterae TaxID=13221 RepID=A0A7S4F7C5_CHRCT
MIRLILPRRGGANIMIRLIPPHRGVANVPRRRGRHDSPDPSPPRRREHHDAPDPSPPRRRERHDSPDPSPPRRRGRHDSPDPSPPRRRHQRSSPDRSPPRHRTAQSSSDATAPTNRTARESDSSPTAKKQGGLQTNVAAEVAQLKQAQSRQIEASDPAELGAGADTVRRDRHGRKLEGLNAMLEMERAGDGAAKPVKPVWGSGLAQQRSKKEQREYEREWANKPLAQYEDNAERDASKRAIERWGDPMAGRLALDKAKAKSNRPKYRGPPAPPNRFDIPPGHKWDGVDRSNGYEKQFFLAQADARSKAELAHKWAVEDM